MNKQTLHRLKTDIDFFAAQFCISIILGALFLLGLCWEYSINFWLEFAGSDTRVSYGDVFWLPVVPFIGQASFVIAAGTYIYSFFS